MNKNFKDLDFDDLEDDLEEVTFVKMKKQKAAPSEWGGNKNDKKKRHKPEHQDNKHYTG